MAAGGIGNTLAANMPPNTIKGNNTGASGSPIDLTTSQIAAMLNLSLYAPINAPTFTGVVTIPAGASIAGYAPLASPTFTGIPAAPTATPGTNTTQLATTAFIQAALAALSPIPAPSSALPLMNGVAAVGTSLLYARGDHVHPSDTSRLALAGGAMTGAIAMGANKITGLANGTVATDAAAFGQIPSVPAASSTTPLMDGTAAVGTGTTWARADHVHPTDTSRAPLASPTFTGTVTIPAGASIAGFAPLASPTFTGVPAAPTAALATNTTQLATTAFVQNTLTGRFTASGTPTDPAGTTSTTYVHCGYGIPVTPHVTGRLLVTFAGVINNTGATNGVAVRICYGTGTAPVNGTAATGTVAGISIYSSSLPAGANVPVTVTWFVTGLTVGTTYWFDLHQRSFTSGGTANVVDSNYSIVEE